MQSQPQSHSHSQMNLRDLPDEVLFQIYEYLPLNTVKQLRLYPELAKDMQEQIYRHGEYSVQMDEDQTNDVSKEEEEEGHKISQINSNTTTIKHVARFHHYRVNITLSDFKSSIENLMKYEHAIREIFDRTSSVTIKLVVILHYSLNRFTDVKDCLSNIDFISKLFNPKGINVCSVDLQLNKKS
ncbi:hypothetical protein KGF57_003412 [Candida theae]|uniref:F-box domain-containing protein n=1 Tax=Candida theae TaxID=1198502 RepID=A0AAD5BDM8_9ASCO|nr:uncharacterized protein KGF57_003412 [Candida theae]KAI5956692.1 hypothetical protein KGF57_003412 [Candida theae]